MNEKIFPVFFLLLLDTIFIITLEPFLLLPQAFILLLLFQAMVGFGLWLIIDEPFKAQPQPKEQTQA